MSQQSNIEWTDATWNPVRGCTKVSPGCANCYAETFAERFRGAKGHPYEQGFDLRLVPKKLTEPLSWKKPRRIFVNSMSDLFQDGVPVEFIHRAFAVMALGYWHTAYQVLTKRADRMLRVVTAGDFQQSVQYEADAIAARTKSAMELIPSHLSWPLPNVWLGVSVENQHFADERIPLLLQTPAAVRFISAEPLLGPIDLTKPLPWQHENPEQATRLDWVIVGGESGPGARPFDIAWARSIIAQCQSAGVACFVKQLGAHPVGYIDDGQTAWTIDAHGLHDRKGGDIAEWPSDLRVREWPAR
jgi:protein gp37